MPEKTDTVLIAEYFLHGVKASEKMTAIKNLTVADRRELAGGIRDGSLTY